MVLPRPADAAQVVLPPPPGGLGEEEEKKGTTTTTYGDDPSSLNDDYDWRVRFRSDMITQVERWADQLGISKFALDNLVRSNMDGAITYITRSVLMPNRRREVSFDETGAGTVNDMGQWTPQSAQDWEQVWNAGLLYFSALSGIDLAGIGARRGSGSGSRGPSAAEIRNMFDEDQLTDAVQKLWGAHLFEDTDQARTIAKQYVDAIVATGAEKEIDFQTFVVNKMKGTARWQMIYRNKPEGVDPLAYVGPYASMAAQAVGGGSGNSKMRGDLAAGAAALGASQDAFAGRLARTDQVRNSQGFIQGIESKIRGVKNILRG